MAYNKKTQTMKSFVCSRKLFKEFNLVCKVHNLKTSSVIRRLIMLFLVEPSTYDFIQNKSTVSKFLDSFDISDL